MDLKKKRSGYSFVKPLEAPVFNPTKEQFKNPLDYIKSIKPVAEKYGIIKIKPPKNWNPSFTKDVDNYKFQPRVQCLNEIDVLSCTKAIFLEKLKKFWELNGKEIKTKFSIDFHFLYESVQQKQKCDDRTSIADQTTFWIEIAEEMGYESKYGRLFETYYEIYLKEFNEFITKCEENVSKIVFLR